MVLIKVKVCTLDIAPFCETLHCALSLAAQCIVIGPVCGFVAAFVFVCGSVTMIT